MKILISDYDGTLKSDVKNLKINICAIEDFRKKGNHFAIATGRNYDSIKAEIKKYNIQYDYLITNDGALTLDKNDNILSSEIIENNVLNNLYDYILNIKKYEKNITAFTLPNSNDIVELQLVASMFDSLSKLDTFLKKYPDIYKTNLNFLLFKVHFFKKNCNKSIAIKKLMDILDNNYEDIITIGDASNDIEMLSDYNGYKMLYSFPTMYGRGFKTTREIHTLIKKL